jgi:hypothetical protein
MQFSLIALAAALASTASAAHWINPRQVANSTAPFPTGSRTRSIIGTGTVTVTRTTGTGAPGPYTTTLPGGGAIVVTPGVPIVTTGSDGAPTTIIPAVPTASPFTGAAAMPSGMGSAFGVIVAGGVALML